MSQSPNDDRDPHPGGTASRIQNDDTSARTDAPLGVSGILPVAGTLSSVPGSLMGEGGGYGSPLGGATLYPVIAPLGQMEDAEQEIAGGVEAALAEDGRLSLAALSTIHISALVHSIVLEGSVPSESERHIAEEVARHVPGVRGVDNRLTVAPH